MTGIQYIPNSFMPALSEDATNPQQPIFQIGDLSATQIITFQAEVNCDMMNYLNNGGLAIFDFDFNYQDTSGVAMNYSFQNSSANGFQEFNNSVRVPNIAIIGGTNTGYVADDLGAVSYTHLTLPTKA